MSSEGKQQEDPESGVPDLVAITLRRIAREMDRRSRQLVGEGALSTPQLAVLDALRCFGPMTVGQVARSVHLSHATVTGICDRLEGRGLIQRSRRSDDRRRVDVSLTAAGQEMLGQAPPLLGEAFSRAFGSLEDWEQTQILSSLQRVLTMLKNSQRSETSPDDADVSFNRAG